MRNLVHVEKIAEIKPIAGADNIELVKVLDWQCVSKKGEFKVGDLCVYHEIDCKVPDRAEYEFLRGRGFKVRTIKLRGELSQGLALPISLLPKRKKPYVQGENVTDILGVRHCDDESEQNIQSRKKGKNPIMNFLFKFKFFRKLMKMGFSKEKYAWPEFVAHTDEENIQAIFAGVKARHGDATFYVTEKVDYQSATFFTRKVKEMKWGVPFTKTQFGVLSRTLWKPTDDGSLWWKNAKKFNIEKILRSAGEELTIQGESGDTNVQKNKYGIKESDFWVFSIINNRTGYHFSLEEMEKFCQEHGLKTVPVLDRAFKLPETVGELIEYSRGKSTLNKNVHREGVVIRLIKDGKKLVSFKVKNPDFLIKFDE